MLGHVTDPSAPGGLALRELADPEPSDSDVVVDVRAYAINRGELRLLDARPDGWRPGQDVAGVVAAAAPDGGGPPEGSRVVGIADEGGWSERVNVPSFRAAVLPDGVAFTDAAALPVAGLTALRALRAGGALLGRKALITGASGGVGSLAVQLARAGGAEVTALVSGPHRVEMVRGLGADAVVTSLDQNAGPFDVVLDGVGGKVLVDALHRLRPGGVVVAYGLSGGGPSSLSFSDFRNAPLGRMVGFFIYGTDQLTFGADLGYLARLVDDGRLHVPVGVGLDWRRTIEGVEALRRREATGKIVLTVT
jgi:NADPH:quinone reductase-like Zn-dependent oxidoreductase